MARPRYPSDEQRKKSKPAIRVHLSWPNHPKYGKAYDDLEVRGVVLGIWMTAARAHASKTDDTVSLSLGDVLAITERLRREDGAKLMRRACDAMAYPVRLVSERPPRWQITVRNFSRKQGFTPHSTAERAEAPPTPHPSESESDSDKESKKKVTGAKAVIGWLRQDFLPHYPEHRQVQIPTAEAELRKLYASGYLRTDEDRREVVDRLKRWVASHDWTKDGGEWVPGVGKFFRDGLWKREPGGANGHGNAQPARNPNSVSRDYCGCEVVLTPEGRKIIPCGRHPDRAVEIRREVSNGR